MGAESTAPYRPRTPSRLSNCGEMVAESVLEQLQEELMVEDARSTLAECRTQSPTTGRTLLVAMKLNATCREMLAWTIVDLAKPGDHIVAFHVSSFPLQSATTSRESAEHFEQLANTLREFLAVYEGLCILKQIKLEVEILPGLEVKKVLVDFAKSHKICKLILGSNKHFTPRRNKSLGRYCLKRLPCSCTVVVLQHGDIILNEKGKLSRTDITRIGVGVIKTLRRSMRSFGRSKKVMTTGSSLDISTGAPPRPSSTSLNDLSFLSDPSIGPYIHHSVELEKCYFSDSSLFRSTLIRELNSALIPGSPKPRESQHQQQQQQQQQQQRSITLQKSNMVERSDMSLLDDQNGSGSSSPVKSLSVRSPSYISTDSPTSTSSEELVPGWPLMHHTIGLDKVKPVMECFSIEKDGLISSPLHRRSLEKGFKLPVPGDRLSVENPKPAPKSTHRRSLSKSEQCDASPAGHRCSVEEEKPAKPLHYLSIENPKPARKSTHRRSISKEKCAASPVHRRSVEQESKPVSSPKLHRLSIDKLKPAPTSTHRRSNSKSEQSAASPTHLLSVEQESKPVSSPKLHRLSIDKLKPAPTSTHRRSNSKSEQSAASPKHLLSVEKDREKPVSRPKTHRIAVEKDREKPISSPKSHRFPVEKERKPVSSPLRRFARSPLHRLSLEKLEKLSPSALQRRFSDKLTRSPIHRLFSDKEINPVPSTRIDPSQIPAAPSRHMSVVDWALQLPHREETVPVVADHESKDDYVQILGKIARDAFRSAAGEDGATETSGSDHEELFRVNKKVKFSFEVARSTKQMSLAQRLYSLCLDRRCRAYEYEELRVATSGFSSSNVVGRGGGSEVYKGMLADGKLVAVKRLNCGPRAEEELLNDVAINTSLSHRHIVTLLGYCVDSPHLILVYNYLPEGSLEERLHASGTRSRGLPWRVRYKAAVGIARALDHLHRGTSRPVIHRDVKASNILLTADFESQLSDFGLAKWAPKKASHILCDDILGTFGYLAPEYFMYGKVSNKTDVYAFGVVLLELIAGRTPIDNTKPKGQENLVNWARPLLKDNNLEELVDSRLRGAYDAEQMKKLVLAASLCIRQSAQGRPQMSRVLQILSSTQTKLQPQPMRTLSARDRAGTSLEREDSSSIDLDQDDGAAIMSRSSVSEAPARRAHLPGSDIKTHFALAMLGVDDGDIVTCNNNSNIAISPRSTALNHSLVDHQGLDRLHSRKYLEAYLSSQIIESPLLHV